MSYRCPVCRTPLWREPFLLRRLKCPRCGAEFKPTVPWAYVQALLLLVVLLSLTLVILFFGENPWLLLLFFLAVVGFFWHLPKLVNLERISRDLTVPVGPVSSDLQAKLDYPAWNEPDENPDERRVGWTAYYVVILVLLVLFALLILRLVS